MRFHLLFVIALCTATLAQCDLAPLTVIPVDSFGKKLQGVRIDLLDESGVVLDTRVVTEKVVFNMARPGLYRVRAVHKGFRTQQITVVVYSYPVTVRLGMAPLFGDEAPPGGDNLAIVGKISHLDREDMYWVKVQGVFLDLTRETPVGVKGEFAVRGLNMGTYVVLVLRGKVLQYSKVVDLDTTTPELRLAF